MKTIATVFALSLILVTAFGAIGTPPAYAQTTDGKVCLSLNSNLNFGMSEARTDGNISRLQDFLATRGYFDRALMGALRFGPATRAAVIKFQTSEGLPQTGFVGPLTRAAVSRATCGLTPPSSTVSLYSLTPTSGAVGTTVSVTGFGLTQNNTILMDGTVAARNVPITSSIAVACTTDPSCKGGIRQTLTFTIPESLSPNCSFKMMCPMYMRLVSPGTYAVTVLNDNGTSNALTFTVTGSGSPNLSISGLDAPSSIALGQSGTWTIRMNTSTNSGTLHYAVVWGDETNMGMAAMIAPRVENLSTSATFTHTYSHSGTYAPTFTIIDDNGHSVTTSATVTVTPLY